MESSASPPPERTAAEGNQTDELDAWATSVVTAVYLYYTPLLVLLGCVGNLLSVFVFFTSKLRLQSASVYLSALTLADTVFLLQLVAPWLSAAGATDAFVRAGWCQVIMYAAYASSFASAWFVVAFTAERLVAVLYPLRRSAVCTVARARLVAGAVTLFALAFNAPVLWFAAPLDGECSLRRAYAAPADSFNTIDTVLSCIVPLAVIVIGNALIVADVRLSSARRARAPPDDSGSQRRLTTMLLAVSSVYVLSNVPASAFRLLAYKQNSAEISEKWTALQLLAVLLFQTNSATNFCLYCMTGQNFRRALIQAVPCLRRLPRRAVAVRRPNPHRACSVSNISIESFESHSYNPRTQVTTSSADAAPRIRDPRNVKKRYTFVNKPQRCSSAAGSYESHTYSPRSSAQLHIETKADVALPKRDKRNVKERFSFDNNRQRRTSNTGSYESHSYDFQTEASTSTADVAMSPPGYQGNLINRWLFYNRQRQNTSDAGSTSSGAHVDTPPIRDNRDVKMRDGFTNNGQRRTSNAPTNNSVSESAECIEMTTFKTN